MLTFSVDLCEMDEILNHAMSINLRTSLVPAPAVIPAQVAYTDVVAVKKLVVDCPGWSSLVRYVLSDPQPKSDRSHVVL